MIQQEFLITCDRDGDAGVSCYGMIGATPEEAEEMAAVNGWISRDGWHECPHHPRMLRR